MKLNKLSHIVLIAFGSMAILNGCTKPGCMDSDATNYDSGATSDDGSCAYKMGCIDASAINYDASAKRDDGTCRYNGSAVFYNSTSGNHVEVRVDNNIVGTTELFFSSAIPACGTSGAVTYTGVEGLHTYSATDTKTGATVRSGSFTITSNGCTKRVLRNTTSSNTSSMMFWIDSDHGCGTITVTMDGKTKSITKFYSSSTPSCGTTGTATFTGLIPGKSYTYSAKCTGKSWGNPKTAYSAGECRKIRLN